jgi:hypothetical protein
MPEDRHIILARALLARLQSEPDWTSAIAAALRAAYATGLQEAADVARRIGYDIHDAAPDPQEDLSDRAGEACAAAILALIPPRAGRSIDCDA